MVDQNILRCRVEILGEELGSPLALQATQDTRPLADRIDLPVLHVGRMGPWLNQDSSTSSQH
jgi:hypothetical protein